MCILLRKTRLRRGYSKDGKTKERRQRGFGWCMIDVFQRMARRSNGPACIAACCFDQINVQSAFDEI